MYLLLVLYKLLELSSRRTLKLDSDVCDSAILSCILRLNATVKLSVFCIGIFLKIEDWEADGSGHFMFG
jgi:hypothetical protein